MIALVPLTAENARRIMAGDLDGLGHVSGWPHEDTIDGVRLAVSGASVWLVELDGVVIGDCGTTGPLGPEVEIGFGLAAECRGRGYGTELVRLLAATLLDDPRVTMLVAHTSADNIPARRVLEKAGFHLEGERRGLKRYVR